MKHLETYTIDELDSDIQQTTINRYRNEWESLEHDYEIINHLKYANDIFTKDGRAIVIV